MKKIKRNFKLKNTIKRIKCPRKRWNRDEDEFNIKLSCLLKGHSRIIKINSQNIVCLKNCISESLWNYWEIQMKLWVQFIILTSKTVIESK